MAMASASSERIDLSPMGSTHPKAISESSSSASLSSSTGAPDRTVHSNSSANPNRDADSQSLAFLRSEEYRQLFRLPPDEALVRDFNCAFQESILLQGHMYLFVHHICFYSNIFGFETKKIIPFSEITSVKRAKTAGIFPNAIEIIAGGKRYFFASFLSRDEAFKLINDGWLQQGDAAKAITDQQESLSMSSRPSSQDNGLAVVEMVDGFKLITESDSSDRRKDSLPDDPQLPAHTENQIISVTQEEDNVGQYVEPTLNIPSSSSARSCTWDGENFDPPEIPESYTKVAQSKFSIKVEEFFNLFFSDDAVGFVKSFHKECGDKEFRCSSWSQHKKFGHVRQVFFQHPIKIYFGAKCGSCQEVQKYRMYRNSHLVIETSQEINDVPYGDHFRVEVQVISQTSEGITVTFVVLSAFVMGSVMSIILGFLLDICAETSHYLHHPEFGFFFNLLRKEGLWDVVRDGDESNQGCSLQMFVNVAFSKRTVFKGKIVQSTLEECRETYGLWVKMARELLKQKNLEKQQEEAQSASFTQNGGESPENVKTLEFSERSSKSDDRRAQISGFADISRQLGNSMLEEFNNAPTFMSVVTEYISKFYSTVKNHSQVSLILAVAFLVIFLMQMSVLVLLSRPQTVHLASPGDSYMAGIGSVSGDRSPETVAWLERRMHHLKDEILMVETWLQNLQDEHAWLKTQLKILENPGKRK